MSPDTKKKQEHPNSQFQGSTHEYSFDSRQMEEQEQQVSGMVHSLVHEEKLNRSVLHTKIQRRRK